MLDIAQSDGRSFGLKQGNYRSWTDVERLFSAQTIVWRAAAAAIGGNDDIFAVHAIGLHESKTSDLLLSDPPKCIQIFGGRADQGKATGLGRRIWHVRFRFEAVHRRQKCRRTASRHSECRVQRRAGWRSCSRRNGHCSALS